MENKGMPATSAENRDQVIIRTSIIGILTNVFLAAFKAVIGILSHSIAVTLDAVNNLSDALASIICISSAPPLRYFYFTTYTQVRGQCGFSQKEAYADAIL